MNRRDVLAIGLSALAAPTLSPWRSLAQGRYPDHPLRLVIPFPPGGIYDTVGRPWAEHVKTLLGTVVVENQGGAGSSLGAAAVARSQPDGYTILLGGVSALVINPIASSRPLYDPVKDFEPVATVAISPYVLVVNPKVPANSIAELIALAKAKPKTLSYSSVGNASQAHLAGELFASMAGIELNHIPYKTSTYAVIDLNEGRIDMQFGLLGSSLALIREGKLRALAVSTEQRTEELPDVQTMIEAGLPAYDVSLLFGIVMPAGTPRPIVDRLNREINEFMVTPEVKRVLASQAIHVMTSTPDQLRNRIVKEIELWRGIAAKAGVKPE
jgi:tripartite-type tricarboxylate transporter receptor subunit TctC